MHKPYDPSKPIAPTNWPDNLRMPPKKKLEKPKKLEKANHEGPSSETEFEKPPLWDFSDCDG